MVKNWMLLVLAVFAIGPASGLLAFAVKPDYTVFATLGGVCVWASGILIGMVLERGKE